MFEKSLDNHIVSDENLLYQLYASVCGWYKGAPDLTKTKRLAQKIWNVVDTMSEPNRFGRFWSQAEYKLDFLNMKWYLAQYYRDAHNDLLVQPNIGRRYTSQLICYLNSQSQISVQLQSRFCEHWEQLTALPRLSERDKIRQLIRGIEMLSIPYHEKIIETLFLLYDNAKEDEPSGPGISLGSLSNFYDFLSLHANLKFPAISLTPDNDIYVSWREQRKRVFSLHFISDWDVSFVVFKPNDKHPERQIRIAGLTTTDVLRDTVEPYRVWDWISNERESNTR